MSETISSVTTTTEATERLLGFSDAVFAIAITFLALDLGQLPSDLGEDLSVNTFLSEHATDYLVYFASFLIVGFLWWKHHLIFRYIKLRSGATVWINIVLLSLVAALPYPVGLVSDGFGLGLSMALLVGALWLISICLLLEWVTASDQHLTIPHLPSGTRGYMYSQLASTPLILGIALVLALLSWQQDTVALCYASAWVCGAVVIAPFVLRLFWPPPQQAAEFVPTDQHGHTEFDDQLPAAEAETELAASARSMLTRIANGSDAVRIKIFTDGVFAIAVTILALQMRPPERGEEAVTNETIMQSITSVPVWPYFFTFFLLALFWLSHVHIFERVVGIDTVMLWLNLIFLMFVSFMPVPVEIMQTTTVSNGNVAGLVLYLSMLSIISMCLVSLSAYATLGKRIAVPRGTERYEQAQMAKAIWMAAGMLLPTIMVAITGNVVWVYGIPAAFILRKIVLGRIYPDIPLTRQ